MARTLTFTVPGRPVPSPRMTRADKWKKRPCVMRARDWADQAREAAKDQVGTLPAPENILTLSWEAYFAPPATWSEKRKAAALGTRHRQRPDRDNLDKLVLDSLFKEDKAISAGRIEKWWGLPERLVITIEYEP